MSHPITHMKHPAAIILTILAWSAAMPLQAAGFTAADAAALIAKNQAALVEIHATVAAKPELIEGPPGIGDLINQQPAREQSATCKGVVIRDNGLVAVPLAAIDPGSLMAEGMEIATPMGKLKLCVKTTISAVKIVTADGHEYPAEVVLKEAAAGLALLKIDDPPAAGMPAVALTKDLPLPQPLSQALNMVRLGAEFGSVPTVSVLRIGSATPPPTPMYDIASSLSEPGSVMFDQEGRFIGLAVIPCRGTSGGVGNMQILILPQTEIQRLSAKALP